MSEQPFTLRVDNNVLKHLGLNLYSNVPAVLSEIVANAWDADATEVDIRIHAHADKIEIRDNGEGMSSTDIAEKYLVVGYDRRKSGHAVTPNARPVMGRKGIGKLSLFSIARTIELHTVKNSDRHGLRMSLKDIERSIADHEPYHPESISCRADLEGGTLVVLSDLRKNVTRSSGHLRQRLARRFIVLGPRYNFEVLVDGDPLTPADRGYSDKVQFIWTYGETGDEDSAVFTHVVNRYVRDGNVGGQEGWSVRGWIGTVEKSGSLKSEEETLNRIAVIVRGKIAQEDMLGDLGEAGMYSKYLVGEIAADFLDLDGMEDIATSSRQAIVQDDDRFMALRSFLATELKHIQSSWTGLRNDEGVKKALEHEAIREWFDTLGSSDLKHKAKSLFGKIGRLTIDDDDARLELTRHSVLAFESLRYKDQLDALERVGPEDMETLAKLVEAFDDLEASKYYEIVKGRLTIIRELRKKIELNVLEKVLQQHLFDHLWLLDPSWERAATTPTIEQSIAVEFEGLNAKLTEEERRGRVDIKYRTTSGMHVLVELKRANVVVKAGELYYQVEKYYDALRKCLRAIGEESPSIRVVVVLGCEPVEWKDEVVKKRRLDEFKLINGSIVLYNELLHRAEKQYNSFLEAERDIGKVRRLIERISSS